MKIFSDGEIHGSVPDGIVKVTVRARRRTDGEK